MALDDHTALGPIPDTGIDWAPQSYRGEACRFGFLDSIETRSLCHLVAGEARAAAAPLLAGLAKRNSD